MRSYRATAIAAALAAVGVFVLLLPYSGNDSDPPECFSLFGYVVPCGLGPEQTHGIGFAVAGAVLSAGLVGVGWAVSRVQAARHGGAQD
jgi:drug/metabolite transporter (DMT)-like permease